LPVSASAATARAVTSGALSSLIRERWLAEQRERTRNGSFCAEWAKILVIARAPAG